MIDNLPPIYFYLPEIEGLAGNIPTNVDANWKVFRQGIYNWTLQTYIRLKDDGFPCELTGSMPREGIVLAHRDSLPENMRFSGAKFLIVCIQAERDPLSYAQLQVVQNPQQMFFQNKAGWNSYFIPHWLQPGLIPRDAARDDKFENVAYFGNERNLAPELKSAKWYEQLNNLGLRWQVVDRDRWNDYNDVDVVIAVRSFDSEKYIYKPATKLYTAWYAGVPAILGCESAFQAERKSDLDYIEVSSFEQLLAALKRLRDDPVLRRAMVENGRVRAEETQPQNVAKIWRQFLTEVAVPAYERWCNASIWSRQTLLQRQFIALKFLRMQNRFLSLGSQFKGGYNPKMDREN